jgi:hypothetical protein
MRRHSEYNEQIADEICTQISVSPRGLTHLCKKNPHWPCRDTIYTWLLKNKSFADNYAQAKRNQAEVMVDDIIEISWDNSDDYVVGDDGKMKFSSENVQRSRLKVDTLKWIAAKVLPKLYGTKLTIENTGEEKEALEQAKNIVGKLKGNATK